MNLDNKKSFSHISDWQQSSILLKHKIFDEIPYENKILEPVVNDTNSSYIHIVAEFAYYRKASE